MCPAIFLQVVISRVAQQYIVKHPYVITSYFVTLLQDGVVLHV